MNFLIDNIGTIIVGLAVLAIVLLILTKMHRDKKSGKNSCGCGCRNCANSEFCHPKNQ